MVTKANVLVVHGTGGSPQGNWFPWLSEKLRADGHEVLVLQFPTPVGQSLASWTDVFLRCGYRLDKKSVLVGHSLAPAYILSLLERAKEPVWGVFLVAGFLSKLGLEEYDRLNHTFTSREVDWPTVRRNAGAIRVYNSDNDPYVPLSEGRNLAGRLGVDLNVVKGGGHLNAEAGYLEYPALLTDIRRLVAHPA